MELLRFQCRLATGSSHLTSRSPRSAFRQRPGLRPLVEKRGLQKSLLVHFRLSQTIKACRCGHSRHIPHRPHRTQGRHRVHRLQPIRKVALARLHYIRHIANDLRLARAFMRCRRRFRQVIHQASRGDRTARGIPALHLSGAIHPARATTHGCRPGRACRNWEGLSASACSLNSIRCSALIALNEPLAMSRSVVLASARRTLGDARLADPALQGYREGGKCVRFDMARLRGLLALRHDLLKL